MRSVASAIRHLSLACFTAFLVNACAPPKQDSQVSFDGNKVNQLYGERRLDQMSFVAAHNAFANSGDGVWLVPNQWQSVQKQLESGVRSMSLDFHSYKGKATLCHELCVGVPLIHSRMEVAKVFATIASFLEKNPEAVIMIFIEDYTSAAEMQKALDEVPNFKKFIFNPYAEGVTTRGWPKVRDIVASNRRLLLFSSRNDKKAMGVAFDQDLIVENYWSLGHLGKDRECRTRWDHIPLNKREPGFERLFVMNHFRNIPTLITAAIDNRVDDIMKRIETECIPAAGRTPNVLFVDFHDKADRGAHKVVERLNQRSR